MKNRPRSCQLWIDEVEKFRLPLNSSFSANWQPVTSFNSLSLSSSVFRPESFIRRSRLKRHLLQCIVEKKITVTYRLFNDINYGRTFSGPVSKRVCFPDERTWLNAAHREKREIHHRAKKISQKNLFGAHGSLTQHPIVKTQEGV